MREPRMRSILSTMVVAWKSLRPPLSSHTRSVVGANGYRSPTIVQERTIPLFMQGRDVVVEAVTGSGKTLAFVIPIAEMLLRHISSHGVWSSGDTGAIIITPTRELAAQVSEVCQTFLPCGLTVRLLVGGIEIEKDVLAINNCASAVIVGTPGRLLALLSQADCKLARHIRALECLVLDEADRLLELGFSQSLNSILKYLPKQRKTGLFSATLNCDVKNLVRTGLRQPMYIKVREPGQDSSAAALPSSLNSYYLECDAERKLSVLVALLLTMQTKRVIVFFATCVSVDYFSSLVHSLCPQLTNILTLHGKMHRKREKVLETFSTTGSCILMCTDVAGRGIDIPAVDWVIQYDPPSSPDFFIHRSGRTARMGSSGNSVLFLTPNENSYVQFLKLHHRLTLQPFHQTSPTPSVRDRARNLNSQNRRLYQLSLKAFVSFVRYYYKHECKLIFQAKALDLLAHARGFAILHLPKMPELRNVDTSKFDPLPSPPSPPSLLISDGETRKKRVKRSSLQPIVLSTKRRHGKCCDRKDRKRNRKQPRADPSDSDLEELTSDARALKKFKNGKISETELDEVLFHPYT